MRPLPEIERCVCGQNRKLRSGCCWISPERKTARAAIEASNRVMRAAREAKEAKHGKS